MSEARRVPFRLVRFKRTFLLVLKNRMALTGFILLLSFSTVAIAAPLLTPYRPIGQQVSAAYNPPAWLVYFTGSSGWSQNEAFSGLSVMGSNGATVTTSTQGPDSVTFIVSTQGLGGTVIIAKTVSHPISNQYPGAPKRFTSDVFAANSPGLSNTTVVAATAYITETSGGIQTGNWTLWNAAMNSPNNYSPAQAFDSNNQALSNKFHIPSSQLTLAQVIFSKTALYTYALEFDLPAGVNSLSFTVTHFSMFLYGNTWGLMGTDDTGSDIFTQLIYGSRLSLIIGFTATIIGIGLGLIVGLLAGYLGTIVDEVLMRFTDMMLTIPSLPLLIVLIAVLGPSLNNIILVLGFLGWMGFARIIRAQVLSLRERPFIEAAKASGAGTGYILTKHIFTNLVSLTYVNLALSVPAAIVGEAALSFLGLGDTSQPTWGRMLEFAHANGGTISNVLWWWIIPPGVAIAAISLSFILLGYGLDAVFNPRLRMRR